MRVMDCSSFSNSSVSDRLRCCGATLWRDMAVYGVYRRAMQSKRSLSARVDDAGAQARRVPGKNSQCYWLGSEALRLD